MYTFLVKSCCRMRMRNVTNMSIAARYYAATANAYRCMNQLTADHQRMRSTLQAFGTLVNDIENANAISAEQGDDLKKFMKFIACFIGNHHEKEGYLYKKSISSAAGSADIRMITSVNEEHGEREDLCNNIEEIVNGLISPTTKSDKYSIDDMVSMTSTFLNEEYEHLDEEDQLVYPTIARQLDQSQLEEVSHAFDKIDQDNKTIINEMEAISDELTEKYLS